MELLLVERIWENVSFCAWDMTHVDILLCAQVKRGSTSHCVLHQCRQEKWAMSRGDESVSHGLTVIMRDFNSHSKWVLHCYIQKQRFISFFSFFLFPDWQYKENVSSFLSFSVNINSIFFKSHISVKTFTSLSHDSLIIQVSQNMFVPWKINTCTYISRKRRQATWCSKTNAGIFHL